MNTSSATTLLSDVKKLFTTDSSLPFRLLIILLIFNSFRPDRLLPGGSILVYIPTLILLVLLFFWIQTPQKTIFNSQTKLFFGFLLAMVLGTLLARNQGRAFDQLKSMLLYAFIPYLMMVQFVDTSFKVEKYVRLFMVLSIFLVLIGITSKGLVPIPLLADENEFALFTNFLIPIAYFLGQEACVKWKKVFYYSLIIFLILGTVISFSRGGLIGLVSVGLFLFLSKSKHKIITLLLIGVFASTILFFGSVSGQAVRHGEHRGQLDKYWDDMATIFTEGEQDSTGKERIESWKAGWNMFLDHPLLGVGPKNFGVWLPDYYVEYGAKEAGTMWGRVAHSLYFTLLPETGFAGTILFALMIWRNYKDHRYITNLEKNKTTLLNQASLTKEESELMDVGIRRLYYFSLGYSGAMIAFLTTGAFISVLWYGYFWMLASFWVMSSNVAKNMEQILLERNGSDGFTLDRRTMTPGQGYVRESAWRFAVQRETTERRQ